MPAYANNPTSSTTPFIVKYPVNSDNRIYQLQGQYFNDVLQLALQKSGADYRLQAVPIPTLQQTRSIALIKQGVYDVHWMATNIQRESEVTPVRIPLFKGLIGWRILFIHSDNMALFANLNSKQQLQALTAGQGRDWPDTAVLEHNGFNVFRATTTKGLLEMMRLKRIDYFPRSVIEIWHEKELNQHALLAIEPHFVLQYPAAEYLFVNNNNHALHDMLETGLNKAIADGSFDRIFDQYFGQMLDNTQLNQRQIIRLSNPLMSEQTPLHRKELWYQLQSK